MKLPALLSAAAILAGSILPSLAQNVDPFNQPKLFETEAAPAPPQSAAAFFSEVESIAPGEPFTVAVKLTHPEHWHSYYVNPGTVGLVLNPRWKLPEGFEIERVGWPTPKISITAGQNTYGYEGTVIHLFRVTPPGDLEAGSNVTIAANPVWQICDEKNCVMEPASRLTLDVELAVAADVKIDEENTEDFAAARAMLPKELPTGMQVEAGRDSRVVTVAVRPPSAVPEEAGIHFFDADRQLDAQAKPALERFDDAVRWTISRNKENEEAAKLDRLAGVLKIGDEAYQVDVELGRIPPPPVAFGRLLGILGGMFIGGMILNLMPCVFPVIGLKIMGFVQQAGEERRKIVLHGFIFAAGVILSFWVLAGFLLALREGFLGGGANDDVGWGYQLQNPWVVWGIMLVMFLLALNMFGVFEIGTSATGVGGNLTRKQGVAGTFFSGVLATIVATPCSAPFLGAALGATFALPSTLFMLSFTAMALGLAFPYLLLSVFPGLVQKLPQPGPWMESFKQAMSFLLFATAGFLLWVYTFQIELTAMLNVVIGLTAIATAAWIYGRWCPFNRKKKTRLIGAVFVGLFATAGILASKPPAASKLIWETWSVEAVEDALFEDRPVYVDFTAAWCLTCQMNKKNGYNRKVQKLFAEHNVLLLKADKTNPSPEIDAAISELGRKAIPVNALYVPGDDEPKLTTELFTSGYMANFLDEHLGNLKTGE